MRNSYGYVSGWVFSLAAVALMAVAMTTAFTLSVHSGHVSCLRLHEQTNMATRYARSGFEGECYVQLYDGTWTPEERWMNTKEAW
jgi:hypothetical protein